MSKCCDGISFMPCKLNICYYQRDSLKITIVMEDCDNVPIVMTGHAVKMQIRKKAGSEILHELTIGSGISIGGDDFNLIYINTIIDLSQGVYRWDLQITFLDGTVQTLYTGQLRIQSDITV